MADLITAADCAHVPVLEGINADRLGALITAASGLVEDYCCREFTSAERTITTNGNGTEELLLPNFPVTGLDNVTIVEWDDTETEIDGANFRIDEDLGKIRFAPDNDSVYAWFPKGFQNIKVTYTAGFSTIPQRVKEAVIKTVIWLFSLDSRDPSVKSHRLGDFAETYSAEDSDSLPKVVKSLLSVYRNFSNKWTAADVH
jgi:hypothetical protein